MPNQHTTRRTGAVVPCINCDAPFYSSASRIRNGFAKFCSQRCMSDFGRVWLPCEGCGAMLHVSLAARRETRLKARFCNTDCVAAWRHQRNVALFWKHVQKTDSCWLWSGSHDRHGYGRMWRSADARQRFAHRFSWEISVGAIPAGHVIRHLICDNPPCVRPDHLAVGLQRDNVADMHAKGRRRSAPPKGEAHHHAKLTEDQVREIRRRATDEHVSAYRLARDFGVSEATAARVIKRQSWAHVE